MKTDAHRDAPDTSSDVEELLPLALSRPMLALDRAELVLRTSATAHARSVAHQAMAIVERDRGHLAPALAHARDALRLARRCDAARVADVLATYGLTLVHAGQTSAGLRRLSEAEGFTPPDLMPRLLLRRAQALYVVGRYDESVATLDVAVGGSHRSGDLLWEARGLNNRCVAYLALGDVDAADADARRAQTLFDTLDQKLESAHSVHNRAIAALLRGDLVESLTLMDAVTLRYAAIDVSPSDLVIDHAQTLLTAGLVGEALAMTRAALATADLQPVKRAEILLTAAQAALADGELDTAEVDGDLAGRLFAAQQRPVWARRARLLSLQAQYLAEHPELRRLTAEPAPRDPRDAEGRRRRLRLVRASRELVAQMEQERAPDLPVARLLHGRIAHDAGLDNEAMGAFEAAAAARHTVPGLGRGAGWLAAALLADLREDRRSLLRACRRGLDAVDEYRALLGDLELRALATRHGNELATLALRSAQDRGAPREMLWWIERWRATALAVPRTRPSPDRALERQVVALRDVARRLDATDTPAGDGLRVERDRLEAEVRRALRRERADGSRAAGFHVERLLEALGDTVLLTLFALDGGLSVLVVADGQVRRRPVGPLQTALQEARFARFALRRAAFGRVPDIDAAAARLEVALLGDVPSSWTGRRVVVVPPADLLTAPWGLLAALSGARLTVSPSVTLWAGAREAATEGGHIALVTGPDLSTGESEVTALSPLHDRARSLGGRQATVVSALGILDGARLAHVAAHGTFRADAPMFSSLMLDDGPLMVHDLDRLTTPPVEIVLSSCDSGNAAPIGSHEALGLVSSLLAMGTRSVLASVVPVNDRATVDVMRAVHEEVGRGGSLADGWLAARQAATEPLARATAAAFTAWGA